MEPRRQPQPPSRSRSGEPLHRSGEASPTVPAESRLAARSRARATSPDWNRFIGWASMAVGVATGLILGLWSFEGPLAVPAWIGAYGDTSRRLIRLGHIAFIGLGILNVLLSREIPRSGLGRRGKEAASLLMNFGNIFLPITLIAAGLYRPVKPLMAPAAISVFLALVLIAYGARGGVTQAGGDPEDGT